MAGGRHLAGRTRRVALRDYVYRPRKARIELSAYTAHVNLPYYFGGYEWSIPVRSIAVVDLTVPPHLPFGYLSSRRRDGAWVDGILLRVDNPKEAVDRLVAAGALRGIYRDGAWRVDPDQTQAQARAAGTPDPP